MKKSLATLTAALIIASTGTAFAASTVELTVKGLITPTACTPSLSGGGVVDHGKISAKDLNVDKTTQLPNQTLLLSVDCEAKTLFAIKGADNRAGSSLYSHGYGLGLINNTQKIGSYSLEYKSPIADQLPTRVLHSMDDGLTWMDGEDAAIPAQELAGFGDTSGGNARAPIPIQELRTDVIVWTTIAAAKDMDLSNEVNMDGSATLEVKYL